MKKFILTIVAVLGLSTFAGASDNTIGIEYQWKQNRDTNKVANQIQVGASHTFDNKFTLDALIQTQQQRTGNTTDGRVEAGISYVAPVFSKVSVGIRGGIGQQLAVPENFYIYNIQPAVFVDLTDKATGVIAYKFEDSFNDKYLAKTQEWSAGVNYKVTKAGSVGVTYFRDNLEDQSQGLRLGYTLQF